MMDYRRLWCCRVLMPFVITLAVYGLDKCSGSADEERLVKELLSKYSRLTRPVRHTNETVQVEFTLILSLLINVQEREQVMKTNVWLQYKWVDPQLTWDPASYGGITSIRLPLDKIWMPDVVLINNADGKYTESYKCNVVAYYDGNLLMVPPSIYKSTCDINVDNFPFDEQRCEMKFQSWTYNADEVMLNFEKDKLPRIEESSYQESGTWNLIAAPGTKNTYRKGPNEPMMVDLTYKIVIRRKTLFYTINLVIPTVLVSFLSVLVFYLPTVAGEKIALSISILLTLNVFLLLVSKLLPPASDLPLIGKFLLFTFLMNLISIVITVITINLNFRSPKTHTMPGWMRKIFLVWLPRLLFMRRPKRHRRFKLNRGPDSEKGQGHDRAGMVDQYGRPVAQSASNSVPPMDGGYREAHELRELRTSSQHDSAGMNRRATGNQHSGNQHSGSPGFRYSDREASDPFANSRRDNELRDDSDEISLSSPDARLVTSSIACIVQYHQQNDSIQEVEDDWKYVALVVDRLLLWIFFWATTIGTIKILLSAPTIFETLADAKKRELAPYERVFKSLSKLNL
ncbi:Acetylcholine receptor subunit beta-like 1 [Hypsibius exemplaris]|uniref:Acetylcholine receptor subunit beta-like 1 n=1 Tax=Hypsibius exemplaris TaxID=2072580 RepID=A0A1W0XDC2_HYPEX|nr:Acetylcholine receptor subunit beta-like 1 [Hypsibius exemplaris]